MQLGVIADDFTGATDIASFLVRNGMPTVQLNGVPTRDLPLTQRGGGHQPENSLLPGGNGRQPVAGGPALAAGPGLSAVLFQVLFHFRQHRAGQHWPGAGCPAGRAG